MASLDRASHTRSGPEDWPLLTNFKIESDDALTLAIGAKAAEKRRVEVALKNKVDMLPENRGIYEKIMFPNAREERASFLGAVDEEDMKKRAVMARLIDMTNANSKAVISANVEKAVTHFGRFEGDTGSPEVQGMLPLFLVWETYFLAGVMTVRILALKEHMQRNLQDKRSKRALQMLVHQRQKMLKYLRGKSRERYIYCLKQIGLDDSAVVREVR
jgi:ribosomal protein S15